MCWPLYTLTRRRLVLRWRLSAIATMLLIGYLTLGFLSAQTPETLSGRIEQNRVENAQQTEQIHSLTARIENIEGMIRFVLAGVFGTLIIQLVNLRTNIKRDSR